MPELPDITVYVERLRALTEGHALRQLRILNPFVLRSVAPSPADLEGAIVVGARRMGKRIVISLEGERFVVMHLMIAGRLRWRTSGKFTRGGLALASFEFDDGTLYFTEAGSARRASLHLVEGTASLAAFDRGGLEPLDATRESFADRLRSENHTVKRALTDPRLFSGIGNAYSDEILHRARLSPLALTSRMTEEQVQLLFLATRETLHAWIDRTRRETGEGFPEAVPRSLDEQGA